MGKQVLSTQNTLVHITVCTYLLLYMCYPCTNLLFLLNSLWIFYIGMMTFWIQYQLQIKKLLHFKLLKSGQIICVDKTSFPRPGHTGKAPWKYGPVFAPYLHDWTLYDINTVQKRVCIYMMFFLWYIYIYIYIYIYNQKHPRCKKRAAKK